jgi:ATP-binding cassette subfamily B protein
VSADCSSFCAAWAAVASEAIVRRLRETYRHLRHARGRYDDADTGDLVQRCSSDVETRVFLSSDIVEIGRSILPVLTVMPILLFWYESRGRRCV